MLYPSHLLSRAILTSLLLITGTRLQAQTPVVTQTNAVVRIMAANLNGNTQSYQPFAIRILQGLKPDVVCIQEFDYVSTNGLGTSTPAAMREMIDAAFGTNFFYYREPITQFGPIPNGVVSRYPIIASGSWADTLRPSPIADTPGPKSIFPGATTFMWSASIC